MGNKKKDDNYRRIAAWLVVALSGSIMLHLLRRKKGHAPLVTFGTSTTKKTYKKPKPYDIDASTDDYDDYIRDLSIKLAAEKSKREKALEELAWEKDQLEVAQQSTQQLTGRVDLLEDHLVSEQARVSDLSARLTSKSTDAAKLDLDLEVCRETVDHLEDHIKSLKKTFLRQKNDLIYRHEQELENAGGAVDVARLKVKHNEEKAALLQKFDTKQQQLSNLESQLVQEKTKVHAKQSTIQILEAEIALLKEDNDKTALVSSIQTLKAEKASLESRLAANEDVADQLEVTQTDLTLKIREYQKQKDKIDAFEGQLQNKERLMQQIRADLKALEQTKASVDKKYTEQLAKTKHYQALLDAKLTTTFAFAKKTYRFDDVTTVGYIGKVVAKPTPTRYAVVGCRWVTVDASTGVLSLVEEYEGSLTFDVVAFCPGKVATTTVSIYSDAQPRITKCLPQAPLKQTGQERVYLVDPRQLVLNQVLMVCDACEGQVRIPVHCRYTHPFVKVNVKNQLVLKALPSKTSNTDLEVRLQAEGASDQVLVVIKCRPITIKRPVFDASTPTVLYHLNVEQRLWTFGCDMNVQYHLVDPPKYYTMHGPTLHSTILVPTSQTSIKTELVVRACLVDNASVYTDHRLAVVKCVQRFAGANANVAGRGQFKILKGAATDAQDPCTYIIEHRDHDDLRLNATTCKLTVGESVPAGTHTVRIKCDHSDELSEHWEVEVFIPHKADHVAPEFDLDASKLVAYHTKDDVVYFAHENLWSRTLLYDRLSDNKDAKEDLIRYPTEWNADGTFSSSCTTGSERKMVSVKDLDGNSASIGFLTKAIAKVTSAHVVFSRIQPKGATRFKFFHDVFYGTDHVRVDGGYRVLKQGDRYVLCYGNAFQNTCEVLHAHKDRRLDVGICGDSWTSDYQRPCSAAQTRVGQIFPGTLAAKLECLVVCVNKIERKPYGSNHEAYKVDATFEYYERV